MSPRQTLNPYALLGWLRRRRSQWDLSMRAVRLLGGPFFWLAGRRAQPAPTLADARSILVVRPDEIGDVVMTSPFLRELRRNAPRAWITLVVKAATFNLVEHCPCVNEVLTFEGRVEGPGRHAVPLQRAAALAWRSLRRRRFDLALLPRSEADFWRAGLLAYLSGARRRVGYGEKGYTFQWPDGAGYQKFLTCAMDVVPTMHEVERNLHLLRLLGGEVRDDHLELWLTSEDKVAADAMLARNSVKADDRLIAIAPGGGQARKRWPMERFVELARWIVARRGGRVVLIGGESALGAEFERQADCGVINLMGRTTLRQSAAVLKRCRLFIGNDSGPMHLAAAAAVPVVAISCHPRDGSPLALNAPARFGPWGVESAILQPPQAAGECGATCVAGQPHCILGVTTAVVEEAAASTLEGRGAGGKG